MLDLEPARHGREDRFAPGQIDIGHLPAFLAVKVAVLPHVGTEPGRAPFQRDLTHEATANEHIQAIVDRGEGNLRHPVLGALENVVRGRVVVALGDDLENVLALPG